MIESVKITDRNNVPLQYAAELESFANGTEYKFKKGINIIIGRNGCGKSTLIKTIAMFMLCEQTMCSEYPKYNTLLLAKLFNDGFDKEEESIKDGIEIKADYLSVVYNYFAPKEMNNDNILSSIHSISAYMDSVSSSTGEGMTSMLYRLFDYSFKNKNIEFPIEQIREELNSVNSLWRSRLEMLLDYYNKNKINITREDFAYTFLLDEPDRNLDITRIDELYRVLSYEKEYTQLICVIHNPILIYKLSKLDYINFVEMSPNYLDEVKKVFENI